MQAFHTPVYKTVSHSSDIKLSDTTAYQMKDAKGNMRAYSGLAELYLLSWQHCPVYILDNHNYAAYAWIHELRMHTQPGYVVHIDQHSDMVENSAVFDRSQIHRDEYIRQFCSQQCDIWNFITPLLAAGLVGHIEQIRTERKLLNRETESSVQKQLESWGSYILDIDLDFRAPEMSINEYHKTLEKTRKLFRSASIVTIATSPGFIDQGLALRILSDIL